MPDTIFLHKEAVLTSCYYYGMMSMSFYYGYIDTSSFSSLKLTAKELPYYRRIQNMLQDTVILEKEGFNINGKKMHIIYVDKQSKNLNAKTLTPIIKSDYGYHFGIVQFDNAWDVRLIKKNNGFVCDTIFYADDGLGFDPCGVPDSLRTINFDVLYEKYGITD